MEELLFMFDICEASPAYIHLPQGATAFSVLCDRLQERAPEHFLELEELVNAYSCTSAQEGFVNGWAWAQATAKECLQLRELPVPTDDYGPTQRCGNCKWFVQYYRYTGAYPWFTTVGCGHCMCSAKGKPQRNPVWLGCRYWE